MREKGPETVCGGRLCAVAGTVSRWGLCRENMDGAPINGGKGNIVGTFFGVLLMGLISNVLNILGVNSYLQEIASGALIIISLGISAIRVHMLTKN